MAKFTGTTGDDRFLGGEGDDVFELQAGGEDMARGGGGADVFHFHNQGLSLGDRIDGGNGFDTVRFIALEAVTLSADVFSRIDKFVIATGVDATVSLDDNLIAGGERLVIQGALEDPTAFLFDGSGETDGHLMLSGSVGDDTMTGGGMGDTLVGGRGLDRLSGGDGADRLAGGAGRDVLTGGEGADVFVFKTITDSHRNNPDSIVDLQAEDVIDLRAIDADPLKEGNQAFEMAVGYGEAGVAILHHSSFDDHWSLLLDVDGDARPDASIDLGILDFTPSNFLL